MNDVLHSFKDKLELDMYCLGEPLEGVPLPKKAKSFEPFIEEASNECRLQSEKGYKDTLFYIYTSGTTGLPKASRIRHCRVFMAAFGLHIGMGVRSKDVVYAPLPFYHASGGILGSCLSIFYGNTMVSRKKFSASRYWNDCIKYKCTVSIYIGELCRYLLNQPERPEERQHSLRAMIGNGLRANLWQPIRTRFGVEKIVEFFGSTEGNTTLGKQSKIYF